MRFAVAATLLAFATTVLSDPWKNLGGGLAYVGPSYNATFKAGDTIPFEYAFFTAKIVNLNTTAPVNGTAPPAVNTGTATLTSLAWVGQTGNQTVQITFDNARASEYSAQCLPTDSCTGTYYPKRINLVVPSDSYAGNYTIVLGYTLSLAGNYTLWSKEPVNIAASSANITSPSPVFPGAPSVQATLPVYAAPKSSGLANQVSKVAMGMAIVLATAVLLL